MQLELVNIIERLGVTCVMVTHDQEEAMTMANRIAIMDAGRIRQIGPPDEIYEQPNCRFTAGFIGSVNMIDGRIVEDEKDFVVIQSQQIPHGVYLGHGVSGFEGQEVGFALRPEKVAISKDEPEGKYNKAQGVIEDIAYFGSHSVYHVRLPSGLVLMANYLNSLRWASENFTWNDTVWLSWGENSGVVLSS
jgi:putrescine transport system ATP-binding protein